MSERERWHDGLDDYEYGEYSNKGERNSGQLIAGAILLSVGALISVTGFGMLIGVPLAFLGFAVMFPKFTKEAIIITVFGLLVWMYVI